MDPVPNNWDGSYPRETIQLSPGLQGDAFSAAINYRKPSLQHKSPVSEAEVDLHNGMFLLRQTDFFIPDAIPIALTRTYKTWDPGRHAFGIGGNHPYDICLTGEHDTYSYINIYLEDGYEIHFERISPGIGYSNAVFRHEATLSEFRGALIKWNGHGWTLHLSRNEDLSFPDSYAAKNCAQTAPTEIQEQSNQVELQRSPTRNLEKIVGSAHVIAFQYDNNNQIVDVRDDQGNHRKYSYDDTGHLILVSDDSGILYRFSYAHLLNSPGYDSYLMTGVYDANGKILLANEYIDGKISQQRLGNGEIFRYTYVLDHNNHVVLTDVTVPDGTIRQFRFRQH